MPRVIQIPLSGGDRKAQAKELRRARGLYDEYMKQAAQVRAEAREKDRKADAPPDDEPKRVLPRGSR